VALGQVHVALHLRSLRHARHRPRFGAGSDADARLQVSLSDTTTVFDTAVVRQL
jgi:hypothetical protein